MKIAILPTVFSGFHPRLCFAFLRVGDASSQKMVEESRHLLQEQERFIRLMFHEDSQKYEELISNWTTAMEDLKGKAKHYQTSLEKLMKNVLAKKTVATTNVIQNLIYFISLKHFIPVGVDDYDKIKGKITFLLSAGRSGRKRELYYKDSQGILGAKLDYQHCSRTKPRKTTKTYLIHLDALPPVTDQQLREITRELIRLVQTFCQASVRADTLNKKRTEIVL